MRTFVSWSAVLLSALVVALVAASTRVAAAQSPAAVTAQPAVYAGGTNAGAIQNVAWRRYAYRPYYGGYAYRPYAYNVYRPYYNGYYNAQPYYYGGYYPRPYYNNYYAGPGVRYGWRGGYYW
jgi:hypothetical protein